MDTTRASLLLRIKDARDTHAWTEFDTIYRPMLYRFARTRGLDDAGAEDVVQHCMAAIHKHIGSFEYNPAKGRFKSWLRTLINNRFRDGLRNRRDKQAETRDFKQAQQREDSPDEAFEKVWMDEHLTYCLSRVRKEIDASTYQAFCKHVIEDRPAQEVCEELGITANNLYKIKWRVTQKLQDQMSVLLGPEE